jgi:hypothetical protein
LPQAEQRAALALRLVEQLEQVLAWSLALGLASQLAAVPAELLA